MRETGFCILGGEKKITYFFWILKRFCFLFILGDMFLHTRARAFFSIFIGRRKGKDLFFLEFFSREARREMKSNINAKGSSAHVSRPPPTALLGRATHALFCVLNWQLVLVLDLCMVAMSACAAATRVASAARARNPTKASSSNRAGSTVAILSGGSNAGTVGRSARFQRGDPAASSVLRQRHVCTSISQRACGKRVVSASATPATVKAAAPAEWKGAKLKPLGFSVLAGLIIWLIPAPVGVTAQAWHLLAVFVGTIVGIITNVSPSLFPRGGHRNNAVSRTPSITRPPPQKKFENRNHPVKV
jgi:hypothetical protein